jgi:hypothetical protein
LALLRILLELSGRSEAKGEQEMLNQQEENHAAGSMRIRIVSYTKNESQVKEFSNEALKW